MEPIPETRQALEGLGQYGDSALQDDLTDIAAPGIVAFSLGLVREGVAFTSVWVRDKQQHPRAVPAEQRGHLHDERPE